MAKTASLTFVPVPDGSLYPLEPVLEGGTAGPPARRGMADMVYNLNHVLRAKTPTVIFQPMQFYASGAGERYLAVSAQSNPAALQLRCAWRIPTVAGIAATPRLVIRLLGTVADAATTCDVVLRSVSGGGSVTVPLAWTGSAAYARYTAFLPYSTAAAFETITLSMERTGGAGEAAVKVLTCWIEPGDTPVPLGCDVEPWVADGPLPTYWPRLIATKLASALSRPSVACSYSEDAENLGRCYYSSAAPIVPIQRIPVRYGPLRTALRVYANGRGDNGATSALRVWTSAQKYLDGTDYTSLALSTVAAFDFTAGWTTGTVPVQQSPIGGATEIFAQVVTDGAAPAILTGLDVWEEPT